MGKKRQVPVPFGAAPFSVHAKGTSLMVIWAALIVRVILYLNVYLFLLNYFEKLIGIVNSSLQIQNLLASIAVPQINWNFETF